MIRDGYKFPAATNSIGAIAAAAYAGSAERPRQASLTVERKEQKIVTNHSRTCQMTGAGGLVERPRHGNESLFKRPLDIRFSQSGQSPYTKRDPGHDQRRNQRYYRDNTREATQLVILKPHHLHAAG